MTYLRRVQAGERFEKSKNQVMSRSILFFVLLVRKKKKQETIFVGGNALCFFLEGEGG